MHYDDFIMMMILSWWCFRRKWWLTMMGIWHKARGGVQGKRGKKRPMVNGYRGFLIHFDAEWWKEFISLFWMLVPTVKRPSMDITARHLVILTSASLINWCFVLKIHANSFFTAWYFPHIPRLSSPIWMMIWGARKITQSLAIVKYYWIPAIKHHSDQPHNCQSHKDKYFMQVIHIWKISWNAKEVAPEFV